MLDTRSIELINAAVDGELDSVEQNELDELLESSPEAREMHSELLRLNNFLDALPSEQPPSGLTSQILGQIRLPNQPSRFSPRQWFAPLKPLAMAAAFSAGLMMAVGFYELSPHQVSDLDVNQMVGTAIMNPDRSSKAVLSRLELEESWLAGTVALTENEGLFLLDFDVDSSKPVAIRFGLAEAGLTFAGIAQDASDLNSLNEMIKVSGGTVQVENQGRQSFIVFLRKTAEMEVGEEISIEFSSGEKHIVRGMVSSS